ncbi:MAG TPA: prepilin-type N-terminal cleavage/methylation domain-containing protein [Thermoanaerobaculia bacterium]|nr:prepilin-type N-terminal cleavage/methylation domain-containing protein [Thermoanaerobaculia bacterium]
MIRRSDIASTPRKPQAGFTLAELLVSLLVTTLLLVGVLTALDLNSRVAKVEGNVADMQQSLRIAQNDMVRMVRMAGRGGILIADPTSSPIPNGIAIAVRDNVGANQYMLDGEDETLILEDTDVLTVRGVFSTPLYQVNPADPAVLKLSPSNNPTSGEITIQTPIRGIQQDLEPLKESLKDGSEALLLVSPLDDSIYAVVQITGGSSTANSVTLNFAISGTTLADKYKALSPGGTFPTALRNVIHAGILEEYRYYVREDHAIAGDDSSELTPKLSRARFYPGSDQPYGGQNSNAWLDVADNILDLQVALGFDSSNGGRMSDDDNATGDDDKILEAANGSADDWLFNGESDNADDPMWQTNPSPALHYLRLSTLARTDRRDHDYQAAEMPPFIENRAYGANDKQNEREQRMFRRRLLQTVIDLRNLA